MTVWVLRVWEALRAGAELAERRLHALRTGQSKGIPEPEAHRLLFGRKKA